MMKRVRKDAASESNRGNGQGVNGFKGFQGSRLLLLLLLLSHSAPSPTMYMDYVITRHNSGSVWDMWDWSAGLWGVFNIRRSLLKG